MPSAQDILHFWFESVQPAQWWAVDPAFDALIASRFQPTLKAAAQGELYAWRADPAGRLAEVIVLDQFSRNVFRGTPQAFAQDPMALALAQEAVLADAQLALPPERCAFLLMPFMHSESRVIHAWGEQLFKAYAPAGSYDFELRHKAIVDRFGRYPHRNAILDRSSSAEEIEFLKQPGSSF